MTIREKTANLLLKFDIKPYTKGFQYICDAMEFFEDARIRNGTMRQLYFKIASTHKVSSGSVCKMIYHALSHAVERGNLELVEKYLSTYELGNGKLLHKLWENLQQDKEKR